MSMISYWILQTHSPLVSSKLGHEQKSHKKLWELVLAWTQALRVDE